MLRACRSLVDEKFVPGCYLLRRLTDSLSITEICVCIAFGRERKTSVSRRLAQRSMQSLLTLKLVQVI